MNKLVFFTYLFLLTLPLNDVGAQSLSDLDRAQAELAEQERLRANRAAERKKAEAQLKDVKKQLVSTASQSQKIENDLFRLQAEQADLRSQQSRLVEDMLKNQGLSATLFRQIYAAGQTPVYGLYYTDERKDRVIRRDIVLNRTLPQLGARAKDIEEEMQRIRALQSDLDTLIRKQNDKKTDLQKNSAELKRLANQRERLFKTAEQDYQSNLQEIERLRTESKSLQELIENIKPSFRPTGLKTPSPSPASAQKSQPAISTGTGGVFQPVAGNIKVNFGEKDEIGATSNGLVFTTQPKAVVVTPKAGKVVFAGPFQHYKNLLILEHSSGYHSLIAGLDQIDAAVGTELDEGEPVGRIDRSNNKNGRLYYELRNAGKTVKPNSFLNIKNG